MVYSLGSDTERPEGLTIPPFVLGIGGAAIVVLVIIAAILGMGLIFKHSNVLLFQLV
jgi:hypothetical protein